jgi:valyl-tRNA synthetase
MTETLTSMKTEENIRGMDRYEARKAMCADMGRGRLSCKSQVHSQNVGSCYAAAPLCNARFKQWFVNGNPLQTEMMWSKTVNTFYSGRFDKIYFHWMENIKEWVFHVALGGHEYGIYCVTAGSICPKTRWKPARIAREYASGRDTLDTVFFCTLRFQHSAGRTTRRIKYFYPTSRVTGTYLSSGLPE